jgi:hypothetical protein
MGEMLKKANLRQRLKKRLLPKNPRRKTRKNPRLRKNLLRKSRLNSGEVRTIGGAAVGKVASASTLPEATPTGSARGRGC